MTVEKTCDFAVIGAGVFGAWTAHFLRQSGASVTLIDAYGPANGRASSSGETRIIRMGYGPDELYTRWSGRSLVLWREFFARIGVDLFRPTGVLWLSSETDPYTAGMFGVLTRAGVKHEKLTAADVRKRWPQMSFADVSCAMFEHESGVLLARRAVQELVRYAVSSGTDYLSATALLPQPRGKLREIQLANGDAISAGQFIFACGPWLPKIFPGIVGDRIFPTRQEVFFLGTPSGDDSFRSPKMPAWLHHTHPDRPYALPNIEERGFKIAFDRHGPEFDPDSSDRVVGQTSIERLRAYLKQHIPALQNAPVIETRVCQYENTWNGDFLIDRHPEAENVWLIGGGSGHGFKHGPAVGEYVSARLLRNAPAEPRFSLDSKQADRKRAIY